MYYEKYTVGELDVIERDTINEIGATLQLGNITRSNEVQPVLVKHRDYLHDQLIELRKTRTNKITKDIRKSYSQGIKGRNHTSNAKDQADFSALLASFGRR